MNDSRGLYDLRDVQVKEVGNYWLNPCTCLVAIWQFV
jgi:hypothetical protein